MCDEGRAAGRERELAIDRAVERRTFLVAAAFMLASAFINATSDLMEASRLGRLLDWRQPFIEELSSVAVLVVLFPLVVRFHRAVPFTVETWRTALPLHVAGSLVFSTLHVAGMLALRMLAFPAVLAAPYVLFDSPVRVAIYEYRKDALTYATFILVLYMTREIVERRREAAAARAEARESGRITLKCGGRTIWLPAAAVEWVEAAGNYVEVRANGSAHLARTSLSAIENQLRDAGLAVSRVHRSYLVNRARVLETVPTGDGDFRIRMADGSEIRGSRRYRGNLAD